MTLRELTPIDIFSSKAYRNYLHWSDGPEAFSKCLSSNNTRLSVGLMTLTTGKGNSSLVLVTNKSQLIERKAGVGKTVETRKSKWQFGSVQLKKSRHCHWRRLLLWHRLWSLLRDCVLCPNSSRQRCVFWLQWLFVGLRGCVLSAAELASSHLVYCEWSTYCHC